MKQPKHIQQPHNHGNDHDAIQNRLDGSLHWNETIHQLQQDTHYDENFQNLIKGMIFALLCFAGQNRTNRGTYCSVREHSSSNRRPPKLSRYTHGRRTLKGWMRPTHCESGSQIAAISESGATNR